MTINHKSVGTKKYSRQGVEGYITDCVCGRKGAVAKTRERSREDHDKHIEEGVA